MPSRVLTPSTPALSFALSLAALTLAAPCLVPPSLAEDSSPGVAAARSYRQAHGAQILRDFAEILALPNVASDEEGIRRNARFLLEAFARRGASMELLEVPGAPPVVFGQLPAPGADRTLVLYVHYDGQPVDPDRWTNPPWEPTLYTAAIEAGGKPRPFPQPGEQIDPEWRLYARSAGDDKAPLGALLAALDALEAAGVPRRVNLKLFFEGEEEAGSPHLGQMVERYRDRLDGDLWLFLDGPVHQSGRPQIFFGVRGITQMEITVYGANRYLHSGHYGNWAPNPNLLLAHLLASMKDPDGQVLVEGYYDSVEPLGAAERKALESAPKVGPQLRRELGLAATEGADAPYLERLLLPSLNIRGMVGATVGATARNVIPPSATASLDLRLVRGNDPEAMLDLVEAHIRRQGFHVVRQDPDVETRLAHPRLAKVVRQGGYPAVRTSMDLPLAQEVVAAATRAAGGQVVVLPSLGGSLPLYLFADVLGRPLIGVPMANHDDNQHAPDENLRLGNLWYGMDLLAEILSMP